MAANTLPPTTHIGRVRLRVADAARSVRFYENVLGLQRVPDSGDEPPRTPTADAALSAGGDAPALLVLDERAGARGAPPNSTGLFHFALLVPDRAALAAALRRIADSGWPLDGASDHYVSEALYLTDPDGNGIEVYADRPREVWRRAGGEVQMGTERLDLRGLMAQAGDSSTDSGRNAESAVESPAGTMGSAAGGTESVAGDDAPVPAISPKTAMGHIHLCVSALGPAEAFYHDLLGLDVTVRSYPGALFLSAGGYHHHIGANIWRSRGGSPAPEGAAGLVDYAIVLPDDGVRERLIERARDGGVDVVETDEGDRLHDPDGNAIVLVS